MEHIILNNGSDGAALAKVALKALREARSSKTSNSGSVFVSDGQTDADGVALGTGTIINGVNGGVQPWVGDTTAPGKPLGISAESHNGAVWVSWDGTLDGGIPADFDHVQFTAVDGSQTVDMGQLTAAGKVTAAELTAGDTVTITAVAYDNAHAADGSSAPNASAPSDPVTVVVQSAVDAAVVKKAQDDAQSALDKAGQATDTATAAKQASEGAKADAANAVATANSANDTSKTASTTATNALAAAQGAQLTADGKNKIFSAASEPAHTGLVPGDLWFQLDSSSHVKGIQVWNGSAFVDYLVVANEILVAGSVGTVEIADGAISTDKLVANAVTADKLASRAVTADKADIGSLSAAIVSSDKFKTTSGDTGFNDSQGFYTGNASNGQMRLHAQPNGVGILDFSVDGRTIGQLDIHTGSKGTGVQLGVGNGNNFLGMYYTGSSDYAIFEGTFFAAAVDRLPKGTVNGQRAIVQGETYVWTGSSWATPTSRYWRAKGTRSDRRLFVNKGTTDLIFSIDKDDNSGLKIRNISGGSLIYGVTGDYDISATAAISGGPCWTLLGYDCIGDTMAIDTSEAEINKGSGYGMLTLRSRVRFNSSSSDSGIQLKMLSNAPQTMREKITLTIMACIQ